MRPQVVIGNLASIVVVPLALASKGLLYEARFDDRLPLIEVEEE